MQLKYSPITLSKINALFRDAVASVTSKTGTQLVLHMADVEGTAVYIREDSEVVNYIADHLEEGAVQIFADKGGDWRLYA